MKIRVIRKAHQPIRRWAGGTTTQLAIWPEGADYTSCNFQWQISTVRVDLEALDFTPLPSFHRTLMLLDGEIDLTHQLPDGKILEMEVHPFQPVTFEGAWLTRSIGQCVKFNVMTNINSPWCAVVNPVRIRKFSSPPSEQVQPMLTVIAAFYCLRDGVYIECEANHSGKITKANLDTGDFVMVEWQSNGLNPLNMEEGRMGVGFSHSPTDNPGDVFGVLVALGPKL